MANLKKMTRLLFIYSIILLTSCNQHITENDNSNKIESNASDKKSNGMIESSTNIDTEKLKNITRDTIKQITVKDPIRTITRIFDTYNKYDESTDSQSNLDSMRIALNQLKDSNNLTTQDLTLIINVWMYYTVTDFSTRELTENVLIAHKNESVITIKERMKNKYDWEKVDGAPYSELEYLLNRIEK